MINPPPNFQEPARQPALSAHTQDTLNFNLAEVHSVETNEFSGNLNQFG